jgi:hypothetical protein
MNITPRRARDIRKNIIKQIEEDTCGGTDQIDLKKIECYVPRVFIKPSKSRAGRKKVVQQHDLFETTLRQDQASLFDEIQGVE